MKKPLFLAILSFVMIGCNSEEPSQIIENSGSKQNVYKAPRKWGEEELGIDTAAFKAIAQKLVMSNMPISVCEDVHQIIQNSMDAGLGEACYVKEVISDNPKMWVPESTQTTNFFNNTLKFSFTEQSSDSIYITPEILDKVQIYWPYSENWDGVTKPLITWYGERFNPSTNFAYVYSNGQLRRIHVDKEYAQEHPVWIINSSRYPHSCFPSIANNNSRLMVDNLLINHDGYIIEFMKPEFIDHAIDGDVGSGGGNNSNHNFITDASEISHSNGHYIYISDITVHTPENFYFDDNERLHLLVEVMYINNNRLLPDKPKITDIPIHISEIETIVHQNYKIFSWHPNMQDFAIIVYNRDKLNKILDNVYSGTLSYIGNYLYTSRNFEIPYSSYDNIVLMRKYTKSEFYNNGIIKNKQIGNNVEWQYYIEPYRITDFN